MTAKTRIIEELGETALVLPNLVASGLQANDRAKYYMSLLQASHEHATRPNHAPPDLRAEREASGEEDVALDEVVAGSRAMTDDIVVVPHATAIHDRLLASIDQMMAPLRVPGFQPDRPLGAYEQRLAALRDVLPGVTADAVPSGYVDAVTRVGRDGPDSIHLLVMDLHRELNGAQARLAEHVVDGARVYGLADADVQLVGAFMHGVNATAPLKFDHPGLDTTATRAGDRLVIQNDIGTTDVHMFVLHVEGTVLSFIYTDIHRPRLQFFKQMLAAAGLEWGARSASGAGYETLVGRRACDTVDELAGLLTLIGSRLVFLIDWNRARKRLSRFVRKADAIDALGWAAEYGVGHRAFLEAGGERLIYSVLERTAAPQLRYGARLDEILGRDAALAFLKAVLRITSDALQQHRSVRLVRDEVQAELVGHLNESQQGVLSLAADHAALVVALAEAVRQALRYLREGRDKDLAALSERAKRWESKADQIVSRVRQLQRVVSDAPGAGRLLPDADDVADGLEESIFLVSLLRDHHPGSGAVDTLEGLADLAALGAQEYVKCIEIARDIQRGGTREDIDEFLVAVDRVTIIEHESDAAERRAKALMLETAGNFRALHLLAQIAKALEESSDGLARCALGLKDHVMSDVLVY